MKLAISATLIKELREKTGVGIMDCKAALTECDGDLDKAVDHLRKKGIATAKKRGGRETVRDRFKPTFMPAAKSAFSLKQTVKRTSPEKQTILQRL
jgi:hypothetical protein